MHSRPVLLLLAALTITGCTPAVTRPASAPALNTDAPPPDVVVIAMSGRCAPPCQAPRDSWDYLATRGTVDAVANEIASRGYRVEVASYSDSAATEFVSHKAIGIQHGYGSLVRDFDRMKAAWFGKPGQPRLVLLGHSHGSVWMHQLVRTNPYIPFDVQIDLDGICASWVLDHKPGLQAAHLDTPGYPPAINACEAVNIGKAGQWVWAKDVVWPNVAHDLEVQSKRLPAGTSSSGGLFFNYLFEMTPNVRPDGSKTGIETFVSSREDHGAVSFPNSDAITWVLGRLDKIMTTWTPPGSPQR